MRRLSVVISDEAQEILADYQKENDIRTRDGAVDRILKEFKKS